MNSTCELGDDAAHALKPYPDYKDSRIEWLGDVPEHWTVKRGKALFHCVDVRSSTGEEELLTVSSERGVVPRSSATVTMFKAESYAGYKLCWPNDLVINKFVGLGAWSYGVVIDTTASSVPAYGVYRLTTCWGIPSTLLTFHAAIRSRCIRPSTGSIHACASERHAGSRAFSWTWHEAFGCGSASS